MLSDGIVLCGFKGCGKSTLAKAYARQRGKKSLDIDDLIEALYEQHFNSPLSCQKIAKKDIKLFRDLERDVVASLAPGDFDILALGGGTLDDTRNFEHLTRWKRKVYLYVDPTTLWERILQQKTLPTILDPNAPERSFEKLFTKRDKRYQQYAGQVIWVKEALPEELIGELG